MFWYLGYFENGHCEICLTQEQSFWDKSHHKMYIQTFIAGIFEIRPGSDFMAI